MKIKECMTIKLRVPIKALSAALVVLMLMTIISCSKVPADTSSSSSSENVNSVIVSELLSQDAGVSENPTSSESAVNSESKIESKTESRIESKIESKPEPSVSEVQSMSSEQNANSETKTDIKTKDYTIYNIDRWCHPVWLGDTVYNETVMFVPDAKTGEIEAAPLMYKPDKIISVRSFNLLMEYKEGVDYIIENGKIKLTEKSRIRSWKYDDYFRTEPDMYGLPSISAKGRYLKYGAGDTFQKTQICVTYTHKDSWKGPKFEYQGDYLPNTMKKLKKGEPLNIVYNGDSVCVGAEASKWLGIAPHTPIWTEMVSEKLSAYYGSKITETNTAVGGTVSAWGLENVQENIIKYNPDLVVLRFGSNDGTMNVTAKQFNTNIRGIMAAVRANNPDCEFILVAPDMSNPDVQGWNGTTAEFEAVLEKICDNTSGAAVAKLTSMSQYLLGIKRYWDMTGNNINHPNDFYIRVIAQVVAQTLIEKW